MVSTPRAKHPRPRPRAEKRRAPYASHHFSPTLFHAGRQSRFTAAKFILEELLERVLAARFDS